MTPEHQNTAIALATGWKPKPIVYKDGTLDGFSWVSPRGIGMPLPDYTKDLNACHEMEKTLASDKEAADFDRELSTVVLNEWDDGLINSMEWHATAAQRAEAFLKSKGLWV